MPITFYRCRRWCDCLLTIAALVAVGIVALPGGVSAGTLKTLHNFCALPNCADGRNPVAALLMAGTHTFYGTTAGGGANNQGDVFELTLGKTGRWRSSVIYSFCAKTNCTDGEEPLAELIADQDGHLYGTTWAGGAHDQGTVFELKHGSAGWTETVVYNFCPVSNGCKDGQNPASGLTYRGQATGAPWDEFSPLFGTTTSGGGFGHGIVFMLTSDGSLWNQTELYSPETASYLGALAIDGAGNLFGAARDGGQNGGGLFFKLAHDTFAETTLYQFCQQTNCADGENSTARPVIDAQGNLYSTTVGGGIGGAGGVAFRLAPHNGGYTYTVIREFCSTCTTGETPSGLTMDGNGDLFGTVFAGNPTAGGAVFRLHNGPQGWAGSVLYLFCLKKGCADGAEPKAGVVLDAAGHVFGTTNLAGKYDGGTAFEVTP